MDYEGRLDPERYASEEPVGVGPAGTDPDGWLYVPLPLMGRLIHLGRAYECHLVPTIELYGTTAFNSTQCQVLADELAFLEKVVADPALHAVLAPLHAQAERAARGGVTLQVEGP